MILLGDKLNVLLSEGLARELSTSLIYPEIVVFPDAERRVRITEKIVDEEVLLVKTSSESLTPDSIILETGFLIDAAKRSGAKSVAGIIPYVPYSRADHVFRDGEAVPLEVVIQLLECTGLSKIVIVDPHTIKMQEMFKIDVVNVSALSVFAEKIKEIGFDPKNSVIVSPDMGGLRRMKQISEMLDNLPFVSVEKERNYDSGHISASAVHGEVKKTCFIIDDIISSGRTIVQAVEKVTSLGAEDIYVFATHPVLSENAVELLQNCNVKKIYVTDAIPVPLDKKFEKLEVLSLAKIIASHLGE